MRTSIRLNPTEQGEISHELGGTDHSIPTLQIGPVEIVLYHFDLDHAAMSAWLADLSAHALTLAAEVDLLAADAAYRLAVETEQAEKAAVTS